MTFAFLRRLPAAVALILASATLATTAQAQDKLRLSSRSTDWDIVLVESGVAAKYNIDFEEIVVGSGPDVVQGLVGGTVDLGSIGETPITTLLARSNAVAVIGTAVKTDGRQVKVLVRADSPYQSIADLKGKRIATVLGSGSHTTLTNWCKSNGCDVNGFEILNTNPESILAALQSGSVEAGLWFPPVTTIAVESGAVRVLTELKGGFNGEGGWLVNRAFAEKHPDLIVRFLAATIEAQTILQEEPGRAAELIATRLQRNGRDITAGVIAAGIGDFDYSPVFDPARSVSVYEAVFATLVAEGRASGNTPDFASAILPDFYAQALELVARSN